MAAASATLSPTVPHQPIPLRALAPWLLFVTLFASVVLYFVGAEQGATSLFNGAAVHELVHDARHLLGYPCH